MSNIKRAPPVQLLVGNKQLHEVSEHKLLGVIIDNNLTWGSTHTLSMQITSDKGLSISKNKKLPHLSCSKKHFSKPISSHV